MSSRWRRFHGPEVLGVVGMVGGVISRGGEGSEAVDTVADEVGPGAVVGHVQQHPPGGAGQGGGCGEQP